MQTSASRFRPLGIQHDGNRFWDKGSAALTALLLQVSAARLVLTNWTTGLYLSQSLSLLGVVLGLALGYSRFRRAAVVWLVAIYSFIIVTWELCLVEDATASALERLASLGGRLVFSLGQFTQQQPVDDAILFVTFISVGYWCFALVGGYWLTRHRSFLAVVLPAGLAMLIVQLYDSSITSRIWGLALYIFIAFLLLGRLYILQRESFWKEHRIFLTSEMLQDLWHGLLAVTIVALVLAWSLPTSLSSMRSAAQTWDRITRPMRERLSNAVSALGSGSGIAGRSQFYGESLSLDTNAAQGDTPLFQVTVNSTRQNPPRYYWRGRVYSEYQNGRWSNTDTFSEAFKPETQKLTIPGTANRSEAQFTFTIRFGRQSLLYTPQEPFWVSRMSSVQSTPGGDQGADLEAWVADPALLAGDSYQVYAWIANPSVNDLLNAGANYPHWIQARYLQIPYQIAPQITQLAEQVTRGKNVPYEKAAAITDYLRSAIKYSPTLSAPPNNMDPVSWVLFDSKKGFCDYYASAEVLMLRSLGIPARMAVGFAEGKSNSADGPFIVRLGDAHAWPEVYFPGIGWVEFEPTGNQEPLARPSTAPPISATQETAPAIVPKPAPRGEGGNIPNSERTVPTKIIGQNSSLSNWFARGLTFGLIALGIGMGFLVNSRYGLLARLPLYLVEIYTRTGSEPPEQIRRWTIWARMSPIEKSFEAVNWSLRRLNRPQPTNTTPGERAKILLELLPTADRQIGILLEEHQAAFYSPRPGNAIRARHAAVSLIGHTIRAWVLRMGTFGKQR